MWSSICEIQLSKLQRSLLFSDMLPLRSASSALSHSAMFTIRNTTLDSRAMLRDILQEGSSDADTVGAIQNAARTNEDDGDAEEVRGRKSRKHEFG